MHAELDETTLSGLQAAGIVCDEDTQQTVLRLTAAGLASQWAASLDSPRLFMFVPTLRCDHSCSYCQVSRAHEHANGYDMEPEVADAAVDNVAALADGASVKLEFQGGEPLLRFDLLKRIVSRAQHALTDPRFVVATALGPLSDDIVRWAGENDVHFSVSLDGRSLSHDGSRHRASGSAFESTLRGLRLIRRQLGLGATSCVATASSTVLDTPEETADLYFELGLPDVFVRPVAPYGFASTDWRNAASRFLGFYSRHLNRVLELNQRRLFVDQLALIHLRRLRNPRDASHVDLAPLSGHALGALVFNYDGLVFGSDEARMLYRTTGADELVMGHASDTLDRIFDDKASARIIADSFRQVVPGCNECVYSASCGTDALHHLATQGDHVGLKSRSFFCHIEQGIFDLLIELEDRHAEVLDQWL